jgi:hypothetical protein
VTFKACFDFVQSAGVHWVTHARDRHYPLNPISGAEFVQAMQAIDPIVDEEALAEVMARCEPPADDMAARRADIAPVPAPMVVIPAGDTHRLTAWQPRDRCHVRLMLDGEEVQP